MILESPVMTKCLANWDSLDQEHFIFWTTRSEILGGLLRSNGASAKSTSKGSSFQPGCGPWRLTAVTWGQLKMKCEARFCRLTVHFEGLNASDGVLIVQLSSFSLTGFCGDKTEKVVWKKIPWTGANYLWKIPLRRLGIPLLLKFRIGIFVPVCQTKFLTQVFL